MGAMWGLGTCFRLGKWLEQKGRAGKIKAVVGGAALWLHAYAVIAHAWHAGQW